MQRAVYPGSFDPLTDGHLDIITRALSVVDTLIIGVASDNSKNSLFSLDERVQLIESVLADCGFSDKVVVVGFKGLLVDFAVQQQANVIVRGLRAVSDFEFEFQMAVMNRKIQPDVETMFLMASDSQQFVSSRFIKEIHKLGGDVSKFVHKNVLDALTNKKIRNV